jgi:hypothetical protein
MIGTIIGLVLLVALLGVRFQDCGGVAFRAACPLLAQLHHIFAPSQELVHRLRVCAAGVAVADIGPEEFDEALLCTVAGGGDQGRRRPDGAIGNGWFTNCDLATIVPRDATRLRKRCRPNAWIGAIELRPPSGWALIPAPPL